MGGTAETGSNVAETGGKVAKTGLLSETGDRWILDTLIPNRDRLLVGPQVPRTSKPTVATKPVRVTDTLKPERASHKPVYSRHETALDLQRKLRARYSSDEPVEGDILL